MGIGPMIFSKYHGLGNDFILVETRLNPGCDFRALAVPLCDRRHGIGADGLVTIEALGGADFAMHIYNSDGTEAEMCGNATRCVAHYIDCRGLAPGHREFALHTLAGIIRPRLLDDGLVRVDMGMPRLTRAEIPVAGNAADTAIEMTLEAAGRAFTGTAVSMGNPHFVIFVDDINAIELETWGAALETHPAFPRKCNIEFAQLLAPGRIRMRVWERGCGVTAACGTGSCATAVAAHLTGRAEGPLTVTLDGGDLRIEYAADRHVYMTGPAVCVFHGETV